MKQILFVLLVVVAPAYLIGCVSAPPSASPDQTIEISKVLEEVNSALAKAIPNDPEFPALTSINLDLQVSVDTTVGATLPINVISVSPTLNKQRLHHVVVSFVPVITREASSVPPSPEESALTAAIGTLYRSVAHASTAYKLQHGSISLQCTFKVQGSAGLKLVPIQATASASQQTSQTLTINFGKNPDRNFSN